jgi:hypothetical protein
MRGYYGSLASMFAITALSAIASAPINVIEDVDVFDTRRPKRRKTGETYPHSSDRQRARYARQIEAGQCNLDPVQSL